MRVMKQRGFTIIETILFLAVTGILTVSIMVGAGVAINMQRYKDAVATLQSDIQQQYEDAVSIKNSRENLSTVPGCAGGRGQTECILMGNLMTIGYNGNVVQHVVYGTEPSSAALDDTVTNEYDIMKAYNPRVVPVTTQNTSLEWGTGIAWPTSGTDPEVRPPGTSRDIGILVIRSPRSGIVYTFTRDDAVTTNLADIVDVARRNVRTICVRSTGWVTDRNQMSITITAGASSASGVQVRTNDMTRAEFEC